MHEKFGDGFDQLVRRMLRHYRDRTTNFDRSRVEVRDLMNLMVFDLPEVEYILAYQKKRHSDQISLLIEVANINDEFVRSFLHNLQHLLWCIDDTVDNALRGADTYKNEVTKFVLFYELSRMLLDYQLNKKSDVVKVLVGKRPQAAKLLDVIGSNVRTIAKIPEKEREAFEKIMEATNKEEIVKHAIECLMCRAAVIDLYSDIAELFGAKVPKEDLKSLRAVQLLREDFEDLEEDLRNENVVAALIRSSGNRYNEFVIETLQRIGSKIGDFKIKQIYEIEKNRIVSCIRLSTKTGNSKHKDVN